MELLKRIPRQSGYKMLKHAELSLLESAAGSGYGGGAKPTRRWHTIAKANNDDRSFPKRVGESLAVKKKNTVFINSAILKTHDTQDLLGLASTHIEQNLVRIGKKYYRQKAGIPQGSVLSPTLCNYFYADLERNHLTFLQADNCLLLRLIDDFILITTDEGKARRFAELMHRGFPKYGVTVNPAKSLANFPLTVRGTAVLRPDDRQKFPYCGLLIDCKTLAVTKQRDGPKDGGNSTTTQLCRGRALTDNGSNLQLAHSRVLTLTRLELQAQSPQ